MYRGSGRRRKRETKAGRCRVGQGVAGDGGECGRHLQAVCSSGDVGVWENRSVGADSEVVGIGRVADEDLLREAVGEVAVVGFHTIKLALEYRNLIAVCGGLID